MIEPDFIFDSANNIEIFNTETLFKYNPDKYRSFSTEPLYSSGKFGRSFADKEISTSIKQEREIFPQPNNKNSGRTIAKKLKKKKHKFKKCIYKLFKGKKKKHKYLKIKRFVLSIFIGIIAIKILIVPIVLKTLTLIAAKGLILGFFSTLMASVMSLKGIFSHSYGHRSRKDDGKTRVEIVHVPGKNDHVYFERPYRRKLVAFRLNKKL